MEEEATVPGGARGELRWPPVIARKRPEEERRGDEFLKYCILLVVKQTFGILYCGLAQLAADTV